MRAHPLLSPLLLSFLLLLFLPCAAACGTIAEGQVTRIYDGDTVEVRGAGRVRLLGIDAPEFEVSEKDQFYLRQGLSPQRLRRSAAEARAFVVAAALGKTVRLEPDAEPRDRHGRALAYITLPDGRDLGRLLIERGHAAVYRKFDFARKGEYLAAEKEARAKRRGMWGE